MLTEFPGGFSRLRPHSPGLAAPGYEMKPLKGTRRGVFCHFRFDCPGGGAVEGRGEFGKVARAGVGTSAFLTRPGSAG